MTTASPADATLPPVPPLGPFEGNADIGTVRHPGTCNYDPGWQEHRIQSAGTKKRFFESH